MLFKKVRFHHSVKNDDISYDRIKQKQDEIQELQNAYINSTSWFYSEWLFICIKNENIKLNKMLDKYYKSDDLSIP